MFCLPILVQHFDPYAKELWGGGSIDVDLEQEGARRTKYLKCARQWKHFINLTLTYIFYLLISNRRLMVWIEITYWMHWRTMEFKKLIRLVKMILQKHHTKIGKEGSNSFLNVSCPASGWWKIRINERTEYLKMTGREQSILCKLETFEIQSSIEHQKTENIQNTNLTSCNL